MNQSTKHASINRTPVNPWTWSTRLGYNQAEIVEGATRHLVCAGQTSVDADSNPLGPIDAAPPMTLLGVTRLALAPLMFEIEANAAD